MLGNASGIVSGRVIGTVISPERLERAKDLQKAGFVHVTGLPARNGHAWCTYVARMAEIDALKRHQIISDGGVHDPKAPEPCVIRASRQTLGHYDHNNGKVVLVTDDGEVWLAVGGALAGGVHMKYATSGGVFVPCSNGEEIGLHHILERVLDPYSDCHGSHSPIQEIQG